MLILGLIIVSLIHGSSQFECRPKLLQGYSEEILNRFCCYNEIDYKDRWNERTWIVGGRKALSEAIDYACGIKCTLWFNCGVGAALNTLRDALDSKGLTGYDDAKPFKNLKFLVVHANEILGNVGKVCKAKWHPPVDVFIKNMTMYTFSSQRHAQNEAIVKTVQGLCPVIRNSRWFGCDFVDVESWKDNGGTHTYLYVCAFDNG